MDSEPVYRNINRRPGAGAFDDLLDPADIADGANRLALRKANRVRSSVSAFAVLDQATLYSLAIQNVFQRAIFYPTRYGDGSYPVWYGCLDQRTTIHETAYHMIREEGDLRNHRNIIERRRMVFKVACTAILMDLTRQQRFYPRLTDPNSYRFTQEVGKRIRTERHPGLLAPSARLPEGVSLAVFNPGCLSNPELADQLVYRLDSQSMQLTVTRDNQTVTVIDGRSLGA